MFIQELSQAKEVLKKGGVVLFPTETSYGLAADATNAKGVKRIFLLKRREKHQTFPLIVYNSSLAECYLELSPLFKKLADHYWPGPLTLVGPVKKKSGLSRRVIHQDGTIAIRVTSHPLAKALSCAIGVPIVATSANVHGEKTCYCVKTALRQFYQSGNLPDVVLDWGRLPYRKPSTMVIEQEGRLLILRQGGLHIAKHFFLPL